MKIYNTVLPSLDGVISDDLIYFEGIRKPLEVFKIRDGLETDDNSIDILGKYFNDIYNLFLRKVSIFASLDSVSDEEITKMQALLQELIKTKKLIVEISKS